MVTRRAGWHHDPMRVGVARWHDGRNWTGRVAYGQTISVDPTPIDEVERQDRLRTTDAVIDYLGDARTRHVVDAAVLDVLTHDVEVTSGRVLVPTGPTAARPTPPITAIPPMPTSRPTPPTPPAPGRSAAAPYPAPPRPAAQAAPRTAPRAAAPPRPQALVSGWLHAAAEAVRSDLAVHGLAYLGVLLLFAGVTGLLVFSFGEVRPGLRALSEVLAPVAVVLSARFLRARGAAFVGSMLELVGFAMVPIVAVASLTDGSDIPPDLTGPALALTQAAVAITIGFALLLLARRVPESSARHVWAPTLWLAVGLAVGATVDPVPSGADVVRPHSLQFAAIVAAIAVTAAVVRHRSSAAAVAASRAALPAGAAAFVFELVAAGARGWPVLGAVISGVAMLVLLELYDAVLPAGVLAAGQAAVVVLAALRFGAEYTPAWIAFGAFVALAATDEYTRWRRPTPLGELAALAPATVALVVALARPGSTLAAFGVATGWSLVRTLRRTPWVTWNDSYGFVPGATGAIAALGFTALVPGAIAVPAVAGVVLVVAVAGRVLSWETNRMWRWWVPTAALAVTVGTTQDAVAGRHWSIAAAGAAAALALALSTLPAIARVWSVASVTLWAAAHACLALGLDAEHSFVVLALAGLVVVLASMTVDTPMAAHVDAVGLLLATVAPFGGPEHGWWAVGSGAAATTAWGATAMVHELRGAPHVARLAAWLRSVGVIGSESLDTVPAAATVVGAVTTALLTTDAAGLSTQLDARWGATAVSTAAVVVALIVRVVPWRRAHRTTLAWLAATSAVVAGLVPVLSVPVRTVLDNELAWQLFAALGGVLCVVVVSAPPRPPAFRWLGWSATGGLVPVVAHQVGVPARWIDAVVATVGGVALVATLLVDRRRHGPELRPLAGSPGLVPPVVVATIALFAGGVSSLTDSSHTVAVWTVVGFAAAAFAVAGASRLGSLSALGYLLANHAMLMHAPWQPADHPWSLVPVVVLLLGIAALARRLPDRRAPYRWDAAAFVAAHLVAFGALLLTIMSGSLPATALGLSATSLAIAVVLRRSPWIAGGAALALIGAAAAGPGWLSAALAVEAVAGHLAERWLEPPARATVLAVSSVCLVASWTALLDWQFTSGASVLVATMLLAPLAAVACATALRFGVFPRDSMVHLLAVAATLSVLPAGLTLDIAVDHVVGGSAAACGSLLLAAAAGQLATIFGPRVREVAGVLAAATWAPLLVAWQPTPSAASIAATVVAVGAVLVALGLHVVARTQHWVIPTGIVFAVSQCLGVAAAIAALPDRMLLSGVLLAIATELVVAGVTLGRSGVLVAAPATACASWLVYASDSLRGNPNWFSVPIGLALLATVGVLRWSRRRTGGRVAAPDVVLLEFVGMTTTVAAALVALARGDLWYSLLAIGTGVALAVWGAATRVRRRLDFGAGTVLVSVLLLAAVPLSTADIWTGAALWLTIIAVGAAATLVAAFLERGKTLAEHAIAAFGEFTVGWERIDTSWWHRHPQPHGPGPSR